MSVPLDRLYNFLHDRCNHDVLIYHFYPHGSKKPEDVRPLYSPDSVKAFLNVPILFHDQEPLNFDIWAGVSAGYKIANYPFSKLRVKVGRFSTYDKPILVHSELNSAEAEKFDRDGAVLVYYWSHALIARDWFRYAEYDHTLKEKTQHKKFLIYNRAWKGSREYRLKLADLLVDNNLHDCCVTSFNPTDDNEPYVSHCFVNEQFRPARDNLEKFFPLNTAPSWASADYCATDYQSTDIEIVLETLFDDARWHLTEKTLRAIAVGQPFVLCSTPGSLEYLRRYGFQTYHQCWDESYDSISDPIQRLHAIVKLMKNLTDVDLTLARSIARYNQQHFFSKKFINQVITEFESNIAQGIKEVKKHQSGAYFFRHIDSFKGVRDSIPNSVIEYAEKIHKQWVNNSKEIDNELVQTQTREASSRSVTH